MSDEIPRRSKPKNAPPAPRGYRTSRRSSKAAKSAKRVERIDQVTQSASRFAKTIRDIGYYLALLVAGLLVATLVLVLAASAVNGVARWTLLRRAERSGSLAEMERRSKDNLLVIGVVNILAAGGAIEERQFGDRLVRQWVDDAWHASRNHDHPIRERHERLLVAPLDDRLGRDIRAE